MKLETLRRMSLVLALSLAASIVSAPALATTVGPSIYLTPASSTVPITDGTTTLELFMDFTNDTTLGGGIDLALVGNIALGGFSPSAYFSGLDTAFSGFSTADADADLEIHFGDFNGLDGLNKLGDLEIVLLSEGTGAVEMSINSLFGNFFGTDFEQQAVELSGAVIGIVPIPLPAAAWLMLGALASLAGVRRRRAQA